MQQLRQTPGDMSFGGSFTSISDLVFRTVSCPNEDIKYAINFYLQ